MQKVPRFRGRALTVSVLGGGLTNRNYRIDDGDQSYVLRVPGQDTALLGIDRAREAACSRAAAGLGVGPEVIAYLEDDEALVRRFLPGRVLAPEDLHEPDVLRRVVASLRRYHEGPASSGTFSPFHTARHYHALARERRVAFPDQFNVALDRLAALERAMPPFESPCPCHNDLLAANFIDDGVTVRIIDWEYGAMGDRFFDLGNLAVNNEFTEELEVQVLTFYFGEARPESLRRLRLMRLASDMREATWGFLQAAISKLDVDYLGYGRKHYERFLRQSQAL